MHDVFRRDRLNMLSTRKILVPVKLVLNACSCPVWISCQTGSTCCWALLWILTDLLQRKQAGKWGDADKIAYIARRFLNRGVLLLIPTCNSQEGSFGSCSHSIQVNKYCWVCCWPSSEGASISSIHLHGYIHGKSQMDTEGSSVRRSRIWHSLFELRTSISNCSIQLY